MRLRTWMGCFLAALVGSAAPAHADLVVSIGSTTVTQGGTGTLDIYLSSTAASTSPDQINDYAFTIQIAPATVGNLAFSTSQGFGYLNSSDYVFFGDSADDISGQASPPPVGGIPETTVYAQDTFLGFDSTNDLAPVSLSSSSGPVLLAALTLDASITSPGESFTVSLVPGSGDGSSSSSSATYFHVLDSDLNEVSAVPFTSTSGTVTISAVPEPDSIISGLTAVLILSVVGATRHLHQSTDRRCVSTR